MKGMFPQMQAIANLSSATCADGHAGQRGHGGQPDEKYFSHSNQLLSNWHGSCIEKGILHET
ncbi:hypothetical protein [Janthinobacterium sp. 13]|uniref:hypothetical protein n=1 Tax=Janthinobacterium sp. 13 TaxID=2035211 RepID=UPI00117B47F2|nr:hypothetical protein [Janthinobacterium sp. 13]